MAFNLTKYRSNQKGFTLLEFMISTTVFVIVISAGSDFFNNLNRSSAVNEEMVDMQQDIRVAMLTLVRDISMAGYNTTSFGNCTNALTPVNASNGPDTISVVSMSNIATTLTTVAAPTASQLILASNVTGSISLNGILATNAVGTGSTVTITPPLAQGETYPVGTPILTPSCIEYQVDTNNRQLTRTVNGVQTVLANGVLDMQFAYALDANEDGLIDDTNTNGTFDSSDFVNLPTDLDAIRLVRVSLFVQPNLADERYTQGAPETLEDHDPTNDTGYDITTYQKYRSRVLTRVVRPRNIGI